MDRIRFEALLPRGPEHYWNMMCELTRKADSFSITDIWQLTNSRSRKTIKTYVWFCRDEGHLRVVGSSANGAALYQVVNLNASAPVHRRANYSGQRGRMQQQMWTAIRSLPQFTIHELTVEASTDEIAITNNMARFYVQALCQADYLTILRPSEKLKVRGLFRLKPGMDTGPKAPAVLKARFLVDRNRKAAVATALGEAEEAA